jgi:peptide/nickel transport system permease protein
MRRPGGLELAAGLLLFGLLLAAGAVGPRLAGHDPQFVQLDARLLSPFSPGHVLGTDHLGRDVAARLLQGLRWSVGISLGATLLAFVIGTTLGLLAARRESALSTAIRQVTAFAQSFPAFVLAVGMVAILGSGFWTVVLVLGLVTWPVFCRVVQAEAASLMQREYAIAARLMQMSRLRWYLWHVLPGLLPSLSVLSAFHLAEMLMAESGLSFLGIGAPLGSPTWGAMLSDSRPYLTNAPWTMLAPAAAVVCLVTAANLVGDGLRRRYT